jgi:hypothetical protein
MKLRLERFEYGTTYTIGKFYIDGVFHSFSLEDVVRKGEKVNGQSAIPVGTYSVIIDVSTRFGKQLPHILDVPNFTGIRIHPGNTSKDTKGCILLGTTWTGGDFISNSKLAFESFFTKLKEAKTATIVVC